jgi:hypothetical protein
MTEQQRHDWIIAEDRAAKWLADGNAAAERGDQKRAERCYAKSQFWLDKANRLCGYGDGRR